MLLSLESKYAHRRAKLNRQGRDVPRAPDSISRRGVDGKTMTAPRPIEAKPGSSSAQREVVDVCSFSHELVASGQ